MTGTKEATPAALEGRWTVR